MVKNPKLLSLLIYLLSIHIAISYDMLSYGIPNNYMQSYTIDLTNEETLIQFTIDSKNFLGNKKGIFIYLDDIQTGYASHTIWAGDMSMEFESKYIYANLDLTVFQFRQKNLVKEYESFTIRLTPISPGSSVTLRVETTDEGVVINTGERENKLFNVEFTYGYNDPFYIVSTFQESKESILYIDQKTGLFPIDMINSPSDSHILPLNSDKHFIPLLGHFSRLDTKFEILHINKGEYGHANYYLIVENQLTISNKNSINSFHIPPNKVITITGPSYSNQNLKIKLEKIMGNSTVQVSIDDGKIMEQLTNEEGEKSKYISYSKTTSGKIKFSVSSDEDCIISITIVEANLFKIDNLIDGKSYENIQHLLLKFPRNTGEVDDYTKAEITIHLQNIETPTNLLTIIDQEQTDYLDYVPDFQYSANFVYSGITLYDSTKISTFNPYDARNVSSSETAFLSIIFTDEPQSFSIEVSYKIKDSEGIENASPNTFIYLKNNEDWQRRFLMQRTEVKCQGFYLMIHMCNFDYLRTQNQVMLNYYKEKSLWSSSISKEYQVFKLENSFQDLDFQIGSFDIDTDYRDYIMTYYQVSHRREFYMGPDPEKINQKIKFLHSRIFNFELEGNKLSWSTPLFDDEDSSGIYVDGKEYLICTLEDNEENRKYASNECFIEDKLKKEEITCVTETEQSIELNEGQKSYLISIFESVHLPVLVRYPVGVFKYGSNAKSKEDEEMPYNIGEYKELMTGSSIYAYSNQNTKMYFNLANMELGQEGLVEASSTEIEYMEDSFQLKILATNSALTENLFDTVFQAGTYINGEVYEPKIIYDYSLSRSQILFIKQEFSKIYKNYILLLKLSEPGVNIKFNGIGPIIKYTIDQNLMTNKNIPFKKVGIPIYIEIKISENNFENDKKSIFIYTDNIEKNYGTHQIFAGTLSHPVRKDDDTEEEMNKRESQGLIDYPFYNYPLTVFLFRNIQKSDGEYEKNCDTVTVVFYPSKSGVSVKLNIETTEEGVVIYHGERFNNLYQAVFTQSYEDPFYIVGTYPQKSNAVMFVEQERGQVQINMIQTASDSHILPNDLDYTFIPDKNHFQYLNTYFEILYVKYIKQGIFNFHFLLDYPSIVLMEDNSVEKIHVKKGVPFYLNTPSALQNQQKLNIKIRNICSGESAPVYMNIDGEAKKAKIPLGEDQYLSYYIPYENQKLTLVFNSESDSILIVTIILGDNLYRIIDRSTFQLQDKFILYKLPREDYAFVQIMLNAKESEDEPFEAITLNGIEWSDNYIPDPKYATSYRGYNMDPNFKYLVTIPNPYEYFKIQENEFYYFSFMVLDMMEIPEYGLEITKVPKTLKLNKLEQGTFYKFNTLDGKTKIQLETGISPNPEGITLMVHKCGYTVGGILKDLLNVDYDTVPIFKRYINEEYNFYNLGNTFQGMNVYFVSDEDEKSKQNPYDNIIISYIYSDSILNITSPKDYMVKVRALQYEKYSFDYSKNILTWWCTNCETDTSGITSTEVKYLVCLLEDNNANKEYLTNQCFIEENMDKCQRTENNTINIANEDLTKIIVVYKESKNPVLIRSFAGYFRYELEGDSHGKRTIGDFSELVVGQKLQVSSGKYFVKFSDEEIALGQSGIISILESNINGQVKAGFGGYSSSVESETESMLQNILNSKQNIIINNGENSPLSEKISEILFTRESREKVNYYLVMEFDFTQRNTIYISGPILQFTLNDNDMVSSLIHCNVENGPIYALVNIDLDKNFLGESKGLFILIEDNQKASHDIYRGNIFDPQEIKSNYQLSIFSFYNQTIHLKNFVNNHAYIRIIPQKGDISINIKMQTTDENVIDYDGERINNLFELGQSYSSIKPFYLISTHQTYSDDYYLYVKQVLGEHLISLINKPSPTHLLPGRTDKTFSPLLGHFSKIDGFYSIIHVNPVVWGSVEFYFILGGKDLVIKPNSKNYIIVQDGNDFNCNLPASENEGKYTILAECLSCEKGTIVLDPKDRNIEVSNEKSFSGEMELPSSKLVLHSTGGENILSITIMTSNNLFHVVDMTNLNLHSPFLMIKYPKATYDNIDINILFIHDEENFNLYAIDGIAKEEKYVPDPRYSGKPTIISNDFLGVFRISESNPYDYKNISTDEFYYLSFYFESKDPAPEKRLPLYTVEIKTGANQPKNQIKSKSNEPIFIKMSNDQLSPILIETQTPKPKSLSLYIHSCKFDSSVSDNKISLKYLGYDSIWEENLRREYQVFTLTNELNKINILIQPSKMMEIQEYKDFIVTYYLHQNLRSKLPSDSGYNDKIDRLRREKYIVSIKSSNLQWVLDHEDVDKGLDGTDITVTSRQYQVCIMNKNEENKKYITNECYIESMVKSGKAKCQVVKESKYKIDNENKDKLIVIYQEVEIPIKIRLYVGFYDNDTYATETNKHALFLIIIGCMIIILAVLCFMIYTTVKSSKIKDDFKKTKAAVSMSIKKSNESDENVLAKENLI